MAITLPTRRLITFDQTSRTQRFKRRKPLSYWYSLETSCMSEEYPCARVLNSFRHCSWYIPDLRSKSDPYVAVQAYNCCSSRPDVCPCLVVQRNMDNMSITRVARESNIRSVVKSSMHSCPADWVAISLAVVYHAWAAHTFSAGMKCRHRIQTSKMATENIFLRIKQSMMSRTMNYTVIIGDKVAQLVRCRASYQ